MGPERGKEGGGTHHQSLVAELHEAQQGGQHKVGTPGPEVLHIQPPIHMANLPLLLLDQAPLLPGGGGGCLLRQRKRGPALSDG